MYYDARPQAASPQEHEGCEPAEDGSVSKLEETAQDAREEGSLWVRDSKFVKVVEMGKAEVKRCDKDQLYDSWMRCPMGR